MQVEPQRDAPRGRGRMIRSTLICKQCILNKHVLFSNATLGPEKGCVVNEPSPPGEQKQQRVVCMRARLALAASHFDVKCIGSLHKYSGVNKCYRRMQ